MTPLAAFVVVCVMAGTLSGGLILGVGPFENKLVQEVILTPQQTSNKTPVAAVSSLFPL